MNFYRQGDVVLIPHAPSSLPSTAKLAHLTLALGEVTGHSHRISSGEAELFDLGDGLVLRVLSDTATLRHEEHAPIELARGTYRVRIHREYQPDGWRSVQD